MKKGILYVLLGAVCWGTLPIFSRFVYDHGSDPITAAAMRAFIAATVFILLFTFRGTWKSIKLKELPFYAVYGIVGVGGTFYFYMLAVDLLSIPMAAMLLYTAPGFVIVLNRIFYKEPITKVKFTALACTFIGCFFVVRGYDFASLNANFFGIVIGMLAGISYSMVTVMGRKAQKMHNVITNVGLMMAMGALTFLFIRPPWSIPAPSVPLLSGYIALALVGSVFAYMFYLKGIDLGVEGGLASIIATAEPVTATILGVIFLGDSLEVLQVFGMLVVLFGSTFPIVHGRKAKTDNQVL